MSAGVAARAWWQALQSYDSRGNPNPRADRSALARLRRAAKPADALAEPAVLTLYAALGYGRTEAAIARHLPWVAAAASVLAHIREDDPARHPARAVGREYFGAPAEQALMKPLRFRRLLAARDIDDVARQMRRLAAIAGRTLNVGTLAEAMLDWDDPGTGDRVRSFWAYQYYAAADAAPTEDTLPGAA